MLILPNTVSCTLTERRDKARQDRAKILTGDNGDTPHYGDRQRETQIPQLIPTEDTDAREIRANSLSHVFTGRNLLGEEK